MRVVCITAIGRPHVVGGESESTCWCRPARIEADCDCHEGMVIWGHSHVDVRPDEQPRMAVFGEQYHRGMAPA